MEISDELIESLIPAVNQQMASVDTPYVQAAYERLLKKHGCSETEAKELIAQCLAIVSNQVMTSSRPFDAKLYKELLSVLPSLPDESA